MFGNAFIGDQYGTEHDFMYPDSRSDDDYFERHTEPPPETKLPQQYTFVFWDLEHLVTSEVFQHQLSMALACKDRQIVALRNELLNGRK